jgi:hypothetical protein
MPKAIFGPLFRLLLLDIVPHPAFWEKMVYLDCV